MEQIQCVQVVDSPYIGKTIRSPVCESTAKAAKAAHAQFGFSAR